MKSTINSLIMFLKTKDTIQHFKNIALKENPTGGLKFFCKQLAFFTQVKNQIWTSGYMIDDDSLR